MRRSFPAIFMAALLSISVAVAGGGEKGDWEFGPYAGFSWLDDFEDEESGIALEPDDDLIYGARVGYFFHSRFSVEGSYQMMSTETQFDDSLGLSDVDLDFDSARLNFLLNFRPGKVFRPFLTVGAGKESVEVDEDDADFDESEVGLNAGIGFRWFTGRKFAFRLDGRYVTYDVDELDDRQNNVEATLGIVWTLGGGPPLDSDADGVPDRNDDCPDTPRGATVDARGCPSDGDKDGVFDGLDRCPGTPAGWPVDASGCPTDKDSDGVEDGKDRCPDTPRGAKVDATGCPSDTDRDGVWDGIDRCPGTPTGAKVDTTGCPLDGDRDGVYDGIDQCPDSPPGANVDGTGCVPESPKAPLILDEMKKSLVLEGVNFASDSAQLTQDSRLVLDEVAASLRDWPEVHVEIGGHTDSTGSDDHNLDLSQQRAESVRQYLISRGVAASRMTAVGYGETRPIASNDTKAGRFENRRVELVRTK